MKQWDVQFAAASHSGEFTDAAIDAFAGVPADFSIHRLFHNGSTGRAEAATFTGEALAGARDLNADRR